MQHSADSALGRPFVASGILVVAARDVFEVLLSQSVRPPGDGETTLAAGQYGGNGDGEDGRERMTQAQALAGVGQAAQERMQVFELAVFLGAERKHRPVPVNGWVDALERSVRACG